MKTAFAALTLAAALAHPAAAQESAQVRSFLATQMSAAISEAPIEVEDKDGVVARITAIETGNCRATIRAGQKAWTIDWRAAEGLEDLKDEGFFFVYVDTPLAFLADANNPRAAAALDKLYRAMDRAWNLCE